MPLPGEPAPAEQAVAAGDLPPKRASQGRCGKFGPSPASNEDECARRSTMGGQGQRFRPKLGIFGQIPSIHVGRARSNRAKRVKRNAHFERAEVAGCAGTPDFGGRRSSGPFVALPARGGRQVVLQPRFTARRNFIGDGVIRAFLHSTRIGGAAPGARESGASMT
jgi:hypothetical protein